MGRNKCANPHACPFSTSPNAARSNSNIKRGFLDLPPSPFVAVGPPPPLSLLKVNTLLEKRRFIYSSLYLHFPRNLVKRKFGRFDFILG